MRARRIAAIALCAALAVLATGCAAQRPVLYPNSHLESVGKEASQQDIEACMTLAKESGADTNRAGEMAKDTAAGGAVGGATGAVTGAITGAPGTGAAAGAAGGAVVGFFKGLFGSREHHPVFMNFVDQCLRDRGYQPIGWK